MAASVVIPNATDISPPASVRARHDSTVKSQNMKVPIQAPPTPPLSGDDASDFAKDVDVFVAEGVPVASSRLVYERRMGDSEQSYFLPSRADGVNDMYV